MRILAFLGVVLFVVVGIHSYLWWRLVRNTTRPGRSRRIGTAVVVALAVLLPATLIGTRALPESVETPLAWVGYLWLAVMFYLLVFLLVLEVPRIALWIGRRVSTARSTAPAAAVPAGAGPIDSAPDDSAPAVPAGGFRAGGFRRWHGPGCGRPRRSWAAALPRPLVRGHGRGGCGRHGRLRGAQRPPARSRSTASP